MATANLRVKAKITVESWKDKPDALATHLANDPRVASILKGVGNEIVAEAKSNMGTSTVSPKGFKYERIHGTYWSAAPAAIANEIKVKDVTKRYPRTRATQYEQMVALVVADHPYSQAYERGKSTIRANKFMRRAANAVVGRHTWLRRKNGLRGVS